MELQEIGDEELSSYVDVMLSGEEEYETKKRASSYASRLEDMDQSVKMIERSLSSLKVHFSPFVRDLANKGCLSLIKHIKKLWSDSYWLLTHTGSKDVSASALARTSEELSLMESDDISIDRIGEWRYKITLPILLPKNDMIGLLPDYADGFRRPLFNALKSMFPSRRPKYTCRAALLVLSVFADPADVVDYDNFDIRHLINCVAYYFLTDDSPIYYSLHMEYSMGDTSHTEIYLVPEDDYQDLLLNLDIKRL